MTADRRLPAAQNGQPFRAAIPKAWDDDVMPTLEVPLATPEASPRQIPAELYYAIPEFYDLSHLPAP